MSYLPVLLESNPQSIGVPVDIIHIKYDRTLGKVTATFGTGDDVPFSATVSGDLVATGNGGKTATINADSLSANRTIAAPNASGTLALDQSVTSSASAMVLTASAYVNQFFAYTGSGTLATGSLVLPTAANSRLGQTYRVFTHGTVTAFTLTVADSGAVTGTATTAMVADTTYEWTCISTTGAGVWARTK